MATKTSTADVLAFHQRKLDRGLKELRRLYVYPQDETAVREFSAKLTKRREKAHAARPSSPVSCQVFVEQAEAALALTSPPAAASEAVALPPEILAIAQRLHTQDNRITQDPLFAVQQKRRVYGVDANYCDNSEWVVDGETITLEDDEDPPIGASKVGFIDHWEFVTGCFTEQGCKDYIAINGHNLHDPRIYAYGSYRNAEFIAMRKWLMSLVPAPLSGATHV